jgi:hypothetical protein
MLLFVGYEKSEDYELMKSLQNMQKIDLERRLKNERI